MDALKKKSLRLSSLETFEGKVSDAPGKNEKLASITVGTKSGVNTERSVQVSLMSPFTLTICFSVNLTFSYERLCLLLSELNSASNFISNIMGNEI